MTAGEEDDDEDEDEDMESPEEVPPRLAPSLTRLTIHPLTRSSSQLSVSGIGGGVHSSRQEDTCEEGQGQDHADAAEAAGARFR